jgi:hypothetical protein
MQSLIAAYTSNQTDNPSLKDLPGLGGSTGLSIMDDHSSGSETPLIDENGEVTYDKQIASLNTYLDALPYKCESVEEMQAELENIIGKIYVCAKSKNWVVLSTWDGMLQWYVPFLPPHED